MSLLEDLQSLGLTKTQAKLYLALVEHGQATVTELHRRTKISRSTIYDNLERLVDLGLAIEKNIQRRKYFSATSPIDSLNELVGAQLEQAQALEYAVKEKNTITTRHRPKIQIFENDNATSIKKLWERNLTSPILREFGSYQSWRDRVMDGLGREEHKKFFSQWRKNGTKVRTLNSAKDVKLFCEDEDYPPEYYYDGLAKTPTQDKMRVHPGGIHLDVDIQVLKDIVFCSIRSGEDVSFFIESSYLVDTFAMFFDFLWDDSEPNYFMYDLYKH